MYLCYGISVLRTCDIYFPLYTYLLTLPLSVITILISVHLFSFIIWQAMECKDSFFLGQQKVNNLRNFDEYFETTEGTVS